jgi:hypothetical protein
MQVPYFRSLCINAEGMKRMWNVLCNAKYQALTRLFGRKVLKRHAEWHLLSIAYQFIFTLKTKFSIT